MPPRRSKRRRTGPHDAAAATALAPPAGARAAVADEDIQPPPPPPPPPLGQQAAAALAAAPSAPHRQIPLAGFRLPSPPGQMPGELHATCAAELAGLGCWPVPAPDRAAAIRRLALSTLLHDRLALPALALGRLTDLVGVAGGFVDGGLAGRAIVTRRQVLGLPLAARGRVVNALPPELRAAVETLLYAPGWAGPLWMETGDLAGGFRQLMDFPQIRLAVSRRAMLEGPVMEVCVPPVGWRVARAAELVAAGFRLRSFTAGVARAAAELQGEEWPECFNCENAHDLL